MYMAGLLAWFEPDTFPSRRRRDSGMKIRQKWRQPLIAIHQPYSYGDSAGIAPDFPFNPAEREPNTVQRWW